MQLHYVAPRGELFRNYYCFKSCNWSLRGAEIHSDILEIHNFVDENYHYDTMELLEKHNALTQLLEINVCKHILVVIIVCPIEPIMCTVS